VRVGASLTRLPPLVRHVRTGRRPLAPRPGERPNGLWPDPPRRPGAGPVAGARYHHRCGLLGREGQRDRAMPEAGRRDRSARCLRRHRDAGA